MIINLNDECEKRYKFGRTLGQGTFATVKLATCIVDNSKWAIKVIKRSALSPEDEQSLKMEIKILELTNHPNIVSVKEVFYCKNNVYLVMDLMTGGELFDRIVAKDHYSENEAKLALSQILLAIKYCHDKNIVHRDLKPENILYSTPEENSALKIADFGLACLLTPNQLMHVACGTPGYVAPEILKGTAYGKEVDMWSIGVILYILLCGFPPFYDDNNKKLFSLIVSANYSFPEPYWTDVSAKAKDLVSKLLVVDPKKRLSALDTMNHGWLVDAGGNNTHITHFKANLTSYNARRRLRTAIRTVQIAQVFQSKRFGPNSSIIDAVNASGVVTTPHSLTIRQDNVSQSSAAAAVEIASSDLNKLTIDKEVRPEVTEKSKPDVVLPEARSISPPPTNNGQLLIPKTNSNNSMKRTNSAAGIPLVKVGSGNSHPGLLKRMNSSSDHNLIKIPSIITSPEKPTTTILVPK